MENRETMESVIQDDTTTVPPDAGDQAQTAPPPAAPAGQGQADSLPPQTDPVTELKNQLEAANAKATEYLDGWQRSRADFANYKKRVERDNADFSATLSASVLTRILPALDDFNLAMKNAPTEGESVKWAEGIALVHKKLNAILENEGIKRIEAEGQPFDPNVHEAVVHADSPEHESGHVIEILRQGYKLGDRILRPVLVKVAK
jgi:molecular chaperone GrpE